LPARPIAGHTINGGAMYSSAHNRLHKLLPHPDWPSSLPPLLSQAPPRHPFFSSVLCTAPPLTHNVVDHRCLCVEPVAEVKKAQLQKQLVDSMLVALSKM
jgi:hypothetical protein